MTNPELQFDCPKCGKHPSMPGVIRIRLNKRTGHKFYGCSNFPTCKYTEQLEHPEDYEPGDSWSRPI